MSLKCACGNETYNPDGVCVICEKFGDKIEREPGRDKGREKSTEKVQKKYRKSTLPLPLPASNKRGKDMAATGIKKCKKCGNEYKPTSNAQKFCTDCGEKINLEKTKNRMKKIRKTATPAAKILLPPVIKFRERCVPVITSEAKQSQIVDALIKQRDEHRQALLELEVILNGISKYGGIVIQE